MINPKLLNPLVHIRVITTLAVDFTITRKHLQILKLLRTLHAFKTILVKLLILVYDRRNRSKIIRTSLWSDLILADIAFREKLCFVTSMTIKITLGGFIVLCIKRNGTRIAFKTGLMIGLFLCLDNVSLIKHFLAFFAIPDITGLTMWSIVIQEEGVL
jgi:hypothetical protein